jgi:CHAT domain-containing protein
LILAGAQKAWLGEPIPDNVEDGVLLAEEIATMDLTGTDLVVLSACETGLGEITSEGVFGLQRAFKKAGVQTLIMSLWKVDDNATSLFMRTFYKQWLGGKSKHAAFLDAQAAVRECKESDYSNPYYWASFIMLD